jgi:tRNA threonylcarbamoyladenosine biosynthesis protein TsaE
MIRELALADEAATRRLGEEVAGTMRQGGLVFLRGDLGAGKTTLVQGILASLGWSGRVRSPSYALVHSYRVGELSVHHLDLYRLGGLEEAMGLDLDSLFSKENLALVEWPEILGAEFRPDLDILLRLDGAEGRLARIASRE